MADPTLPMTAAEFGRKHGRIAAAMADCIRGRLAGLGSCDRQALLRDGFSEIEVALWYDAANQSAREAEAA